MEAHRMRELDEAPSAPQRQSAYASPAAPVAMPAPAAPVVHEPSIEAPAPAAKDAPHGSDTPHDSDPVAEQSEWLASAVLYEEMTSLLRTSPDFTDEATPTGATYQPTVDLTTGPSLTRRARRRQAVTGELDVTDSVDRDPEVLRERLRAFQSGTRRAREDAASQTSVDLDAEFEAAFGGPSHPADGTGADGNRGQY
jgi:hypothetical protein